MVDPQAGPTLVRHKYYFAKKTGDFETQPTDETAPFPPSLARETKFWRANNILSTIRAYSGADKTEKIPFTSITYYVR